MKKKKRIYFWWSAAAVIEVTFIRWQRMKMRTGEEDSDCLGIGAVVWSDWLFSLPLHNYRSRGYLPERYCLLRPYTKLYYYNPRYNRRQKEIKRPTLEEYKKLLKRRRKR